MLLWHLINWLSNMNEAIKKLCCCYIKSRREKHFLVYGILFSKRMLLNAKNLILKAVPFSLVEASCHRV